MKPTLPRSAIFTAARCSWNDLGHGEKITTLITSGDALNEEGGQQNKEYAGVFAIVNS